VALVKVTFPLNTGADFFANWLEYHTVMDGKDGKLEFPTEQGRIVLRPAIGPSHITYPTEIDMWVLSEVRPTPVGISFFLVPLAPDRVEVTAECHEPAVIGYFEELLQEIVKVWPGAREWLEATSEPAEGMARPLPREFPKKAETLAKYKQAYSIIKNMRKQYRRLYSDGHTEDPEPELDDYREALTSKMGWKRTRRTIRKVIKLGDKGLLQ